VPKATEKPVSYALAKKFKDGAYRLIVCAQTWITDYSNEQQVRQVIEEIKESIREFIAEFDKDEDECYVVTTGSNLATAIVCSLLTEAGIDFKLLVYEKKIETYVIVDWREETCSLKEPCYRVRSTVVDEL